MIQLLKQNNLPFPLTIQGEKARELVTCVALDSTSICQAFYKASKQRSGEEPAFELGARQAVACLQAPGQC